MKKQANNAIQAIDQFLAVVNPNAQVAAVKSAESVPSTPDPGQISGATTQQTKSTPNSTEPAQEGAQTADNVKVVKDEQPAGVDQRPDVKSATSLLSRFAKGAEGAAASPGSAADDQLQIGTNKQPTGDDPKNETAGVNAGKDDSESAHPARTDNTTLDGNKYAAATADMELSVLVGLMKEAGDAIAAAITKQAAAYRAAPAPAPAAPVKAAQDPNTAYQQGREVAGIAVGFDQKAADAMVVEALEEVIKNALEEADTVCQFLDTYIPAKQANMDAGGAPGGGAVQPPPGGAPGMDESQILGAMQGDGDGDEAGAGGDDIEQLMAILERLGIPREQVEAEIAKLMQGGAGGEMGGAMPPPAGGDSGAAMPSAQGGPPPLQKAAAAKAAEKEAVDYFRELLNKSRRNAA